VNRLSGRGKSEENKGRDRAKKRGFRAFSPLRSLFTGYFFPAGRRRGIATPPKQLCYGKDVKHQGHPLPYMRTVVLRYAFRQWNVRFWYIDLRGTDWWSRLKSEKTHKCQDSIFVTLNLEQLRVQFWFLLSRTLSAQNYLFRHTYHAHTITRQICCLLFTFLTPHLVYIN